MTCAVYAAWIVAFLFFYAREHHAGGIVHARRVKSACYARDRWCQMTLDDAIEHLEERISQPFDCEECKREHERLLVWLKELRDIRRGS